MANSLELITCKELACLLKRHVSYVYAMKKRGFRMVAGRTTLSAALHWLEKNPQPRCRKIYTTHTNAR